MLVVTILLLSLCLALLVASIELHWQAGLLAAVGSGIAVAIGSARWGIFLRTSPAEHRLKALALAEPYLEADEVVQVVILADEPTLWLFGIGYSASWNVVATDRALLMFEMARPSRVTMGRLPRNTRIGPVGRWGEISLDGKEIWWVRKQFLVEFEVADNAIAHLGVRIPEVPTKRFATPRWPLPCCAQWGHRTVAE